MKKDIWSTLKYQNLISLVDDGFSINSLSLAFNKSKKDIRRRFKRYFGLSLSQYVLDNNIKVIY